MKRTFARLLAVSTIVGFGATASLAVPGDPIPGVDVSIEQSPGGVMITQNVCKTQGGTLAQHSDGKWYCDMPPGISQHGIAKQTGSLRTAGEQGDATPCSKTNYNSSKSNTAGVIKTTQSDDCSRVEGDPIKPKNPEQVRVSERLRHKDRKN